MLHKDMSFRRGVVFESELVVDIVQEFAYHYGWILRGIIPFPSSHIAYEQPLPGRHEGFQKEVAVLLPGDLVAWLPVACHEIKGECVWPPRKVGIIHTEQAYHPERDTPHGYEA